jgi:hypothetical protein
LFPNCFLICFQIERLHELQLRDQEMHNLKMYEIECSCDICSSMCHCPCAPTVDEAEQLINAGYGNRLMLDDRSWGPSMLKPAYKSLEGKPTPDIVLAYHPDGCTFWKDGLCELHNLNLKPLEGRLAYHERGRFNYEELQDFICDDWEKNPKAQVVIEKWKELNPDYKNHYDRFWDDDDTESEE